MIETFIPGSSSLDSVRYDSDEQVMDVTFKDGSRYVYRGVPVGVFQGLQNARSAGSYFYRMVRSSYPYEQVE